MIVELALLSIRSGSEAQFETAYATAEKIIVKSEGYVSHELRRSIEHPQRYALTVHWRTLEDHTVRFRGSPAFAEWRALIGPFFESAPVVEHFRSIAVT